MHQSVGSEVATLGPRFRFGTRAMLGGSVATWWAALDHLARVSFMLTLLKLPIAAVAFTLILFSSLLPRTLLEVAAALLVASAAVLDVADGVVFKCSAQAGNKILRDQRRVLDVVCDRVLIFGTIVPLAFIGFPLVAVGLILVRELAAAAICGVPYWRRGFVGAPNFASRMATTLIGVQVVYYCLDNPVSPLLSAVYFSVAALGLVQYQLDPKEN